MKRLLRISALPLTLASLILAAPALANKEHKEAKFNEMDSDSDGRISKDEHASGAQKMFEKMDGNNDGRVTEDEMIAYKAKKMEKAEGKEAKVRGDKAKEDKVELTAREKIKEIDTNGDGFLTAMEHREGSAKLFEKMDTDKDGYLSKDEFTSGRAKLLKKSS